MSLITFLLMMQVTYTVPQKVIDTVEYSNYADKRLVASIIAIESAWKPDALSSAGAIGLMQVIPATKKGIDKHELSSELCHLPLPGIDYPPGAASVMYGSCLLAIMHVKYKGDQLKMLLNYHGGLRAVSRYVTLGLESVNPTTKDYVRKVSAKYLETRTCGGS